MRLAPAHQLRTVRSTTGCRQPPSTRPPPTSLSSRCRRASKRRGCISHRLGMSAVGGTLPVGVTTCLKRFAPAASCSISRGGWQSDGLTLTSLHRLQNLRTIAGGCAGLGPSSRVIDVGSGTGALIPFLQVTAHGSRLRLTQAAHLPACCVLAGLHLQSRPQGMPVHECQTPCAGAGRAGFPGG